VDLTSFVRQHVAAGNREVTLVLKAGAEQHRDGAARQQGGDVPAPTRDRGLSPRARQRRRGRAAASRQRLSRTCMRTRAHADARPRHILILTRAPALAGAARKIASRRIARNFRTDTHLRRAGRSGPERCLCSR
jgi:hypothetical protein